MNKSSSRQLAWPSGNSSHAKTRDWLNEEGSHSGLPLPRAEVIAQSTFELRRFFWYVSC